MDRYLTMTLDEINSLTPQERLAAKAARQDARQAAIGEPPTKDELMLTDSRLGVNRGADDDHVVYIRDNFATRFKDGKLVRGDRRVKPVGEASFSQIDGTSSRQDNAMNRFLQGGGVEAQADAQRYRFIVQQMSQEIFPVLERLNAHELIAHLNKKRPQVEGGPGGADDAAQKAYDAETNRLTGSLSKDQIYGREKDRSLASQIRAWQKMLGRLGAANRTLDHTIPTPKRIVD